MSSQHTLAVLDNPLGEAEELLTSLRTEAELACADSCGEGSCFACKAWTACDDALDQLKDVGDRLGKVETLLKEVTS